VFLLKHPVFHTDATEREKIYRNKRIALTSFSYALALESHS